MTNSLFITGASGFIGGRFLQRLDHAKYDTVYCLCRSEEGLPDFVTQNGNGRFKVIIGDISDVQTYTPYLKPNSTIVHFAASTGKADEQEHFRVNATGTKHFVEQCKQRGVGSFLHVSTIAVKYPDKSNYPYAQSKELGERHVMESGLNYTIVRPTIVIGEESPIWRSLSMLAAPPIIPLLGERSTQIQPIFVDDLVDSLVAILDENVFCNEIIEMGGPEKISFEGFLKTIHQTSTGRNPLVMRLPVRQLITLLSVLEKHFRSVMPVTAGQLAAFSNDGTIHLSQFFSQRISTMRSVRSMIELVIEKQEEKRHDIRLDGECAVFANYLIGQSPGTYIQEKYHEAHTLSPVFKSPVHSQFDRFLVRIAAKNSVLTRMVDTYTAIFARGVLFRKKMILLMAIMESCAPTFTSFDVESPSSPAEVVIKLMIKGIAFGVALILSAVILLPVQIGFLLIGKLSARGNSI